MSKLLIACAWFLFTACADNCKQEEKQAVSKIEHCDEGMACIVTLANGARTRVLNPKVGELICP